MKSTNMAAVTFVILNYNTGEETINCINSIERLDIKNHIITYVIVDNNSTDDSLLFIKEKTYKDKGVEIIKLNENYGFSKANNIGYKYAIENYNPDFIGVINSDILIYQKDFIKIVEDLYSKNHFSVLGPDIYAKYRKLHQSPNLNSIPTVKSVEENITYLNNQIIKLEEMKKSGISYVNVVNRNKLLLINILKNIYCTIFKTRYRKEYTNVNLHGSALFFSRLYIDKYPNSCFEPEVFYYGEEDLLFYKCMMNGDKMMYSPKIKVIHLTGASANKILGARNDIDRELFNYRSELLSKKVLFEEIKKHNSTFNQN